MPSQTQKIFPFEVAGSSVEKHFQQFEPRSRVLYLLLIGLFIIAFILLFIIRVDVSVRSTGILKPEQERTEIRSLVPGLVEEVMVKENDHVKAGQPLVRIASDAVSDRSTSIDTQLEQLLLQQQDLKKLLNGRSAALHSNMYRQQKTLYQRRQTDAAIRLNTARKSYDRFQQLHKEKVISQAEFERYDYEYKTLQNESALLKAQQYSQWQSDLTALNLQLEDLGARKSLYAEQEDQHIIKAPASGYVQQLKGIQPGSALQGGEMIGEISPDSGLQAEIYLPPRDIGYIRKGSVVKMQVDAFDYNVWGMVSGKVISVSRDVFIKEGQPLFKVRCTVDDPVMELRNGYKGIVKKGMTVQARFFITRRSLFQLLYDQADDWLNPNVKTNET